MRRLKKLKLANKLILINSIVLLLILGAIAGIYINYERTNLFKELREKGELLSGNLAYNSALPLLTRNMATMDGLLDGIIKYPDVAYSALYSKDGELVAQKGSKAPGKIARTGILFGDSHEKSEISSSEGSMLEIVAPVIIEKMGGSREEMTLQEDLFSGTGGEKEIIGTSIVALSTRKITDRFVSSAFQWLAISLIVYIMGAWAMVVVIRRFVRPVTELSEMAREAAGGNLDIQMNVRSADEAGELALSFNNMVRNLKAKLLEIDGQTREIENLLEGAMDGIFLIDGDGKIIKVNRMMCGALGYERNALLGRRLSELTHSLTDDDIKGWRGQEAIRTRLDFAARDGRAVPFEVNMTGVEYRKKHAILGFARDISERRKMEEQLVMTEKLTATGRLAAGMAHEVNNPLGIIKNYLYTLKRAARGDSKITDSVDIMGEEIDRIAEIVRGLLEFSRKESEGRTAPADLNSTMKKVLSLSKTSLEDQNIRIEASLDDHLPLVEILPNQIEQVIFNLINNAADAMKGGGTLRLKTTARGSCVAIMVEDTGTGINEEHFKELFTPFFTTKGEKGTGLGLSISYGIVKSHGGELTLENIASGGVRATVLLPKLNASSGDAEKRPV